MVHWWQEPTAEATLSVAYADMVLLLLGAFAWEYCQSFRIEIAVLRGRLPFRWPLVPYFATRLFLLADLILIAIQQGPIHIPCQAGTISAELAGIIAMGTSSTNLMIRTWIIWNGNRLIHVLLLLITLGYWGTLIFKVADIRASVENEICLPSLGHPGLTAAIFVYTLSYDALAFILSIVKLSRHPSDSALRGRLRAQGLIYFAVSAIVYIPPTVMAFLGSDYLQGITSTFAMTASTIASCRVVRLLLDFRGTSQQSVPRPVVVEREIVLTSQFCHGGDQASSTLTGNLSERIPSMC